MKDSFLFASFLGAIKDSLVKEGYSPQQTDHLLVAYLAEMIQDTVCENGKLNHYTMKPVYRMLINLYREENTSLQEAAYLPQVQQKMAENDYFIRFLEKELSSIEGNEEESNGNRQ